MRVTTTALLAEMPRCIVLQEEGRFHRSTTKLPHGAGGREANADNPSTWLMLASAKELAASRPRPFGLGGIGLELGPRELVPMPEITVRAERRFLRVTGIKRHGDGAAGPRAIPSQASSAMPAPEVRR
jgi:hypothetical protein